MMNDSDMEILAMLRKNGRESLTIMSKQTKIPISTIFDKIRKLNKKIVTKYTGIVDFQELGYNARASVMIKANNSAKEKLLDFLLTHQNINSVFRINNGFDYMVDIIFRNVRDLEGFLQHLDEKHKIKDKVVYYIIDEVMQEEFLANSEMIKVA